MLALGIDIGSTTTKTSLVSVEGGRVHELAALSAPTPAGGTELVATALRLAAAAVDDRGPAVAAIGVASMAETGVPIDAAGDPLIPLLRWDAGYGADDALRMADLAPEVFAATGLRLAAKTPLTTWAWLRREQPDVWRRMACWLGAADVVAHALTGRRVTDHTLAGRTGGYRLPAPGRPLTRAFEADLLGIVALTPDRLPAVAAPDEVSGHLTPAAAAALGLPDGVPVVVAGHDHQVAAWAAGVRSAHEVADSLGTAEAVLTVLGHRPDAEAVRGNGMSLVRTIPGTAEALVAGSSSAGAMLGHWLEPLDPDRRHGVLEDAARDAATDPEPTGSAVPPYLRGRQTPAPDPDAVAGTPPGVWPLARQARAVVEGICYQARWMIAAQAGGRGPREVTVIGGDRLPRLWVDLKRATLPWPVATVRAAEPVASGAALLALTRSGALGPPQEQLQAAPTLDRTSHEPPEGDPHGAAFADFVDRVCA